MENKKCNKCGIEKQVSEFYFRKDNNKYRHECKSCMSDAANNNYKKNKDHYKIIRNKYYKENKDKFLEDVNKYYQINRDKRLIQMREYRLKNIDIRRDKERERKIKYDNNINYRLRRTLRSRIREALKVNNLKKENSIIELIGCTIRELKLHLESQFKPGMTWDNYGFYGWHIDHIIPLVMFDLTDIKQQKIACNWKNIQPLWANENLSKGVKV